MAFYVGMNPKNRRVYIRGVRDEMGSVVEYPRYLLENFNIQYSEDLHKHKLTPIPDCIKVFVENVCENKKLILDSFDAGLLEIVL